MNRDIKAVFSIYDNNQQTTHTFFVKLGEDDEKSLDLKIEEAFQECKRQHRLEMLFDDSDQTQYHFQKYVSPFEINSLDEDYKEIHDNLIEIDYYAKKNNEHFNQLRKEKLTFNEMFNRSIFKS